MKGLWDRFGDYHQENAGSDWKHLEIPCEHFEVFPVPTVGSKCVETHGTAAEYIFLLVYPACTGLRWGNFKLEHIGVFP